MSFRDICGHEKQLAKLQSLLIRGRVPHAFLFHGMEGTGKRTTAWTLAKALNCLNGPGDSCDVCPQCRKADHKNHPDIIILQPEGQFIKIQAVRDLRERMKFKPWEGKKRVSIIDDADRMNDAAANALLKTLEEPPPANIIILVSANPVQLPATILSRCQQVRFNPLSEEQVASFLEQKFSLDAAAARLLAASSGGSIARACDMHHGAFLDSRNAIMDWAASGLTDDPLLGLSSLNRFGQDREEVMEKLGILRSCYRDAMVYKEMGAGGPLINRDRVDIIKALAARRPVKDMVSDIRAIERALSAIEQHADKTLTLEVMMFRLK